MMSLSRKVVALPLADCCPGPATWDSAVSNMRAGCAGTANPYRERKFPPRADYCNTSAPARTNAPPDRRAVFPKALGSLPDRDAGRARRPARDSRERFAPLTAAGRQFLQIARGKVRQISLRVRHTPRWSDLPLLVAK